MTDRQLVLETLLDSNALFETYRALDTEQSTADTRRYVSVCLFAPSVGSSDAQANELKREFMGIQYLAHPNIARLFELGWHDGRYFMVGEYVDGEPLSSVLENLQPEHLDAPEADAIVHAVGEALAHAHANGVVHGDVRSRNVLVSVGAELKLANLVPPSARDSAEPPSRADDVRGLAALAYELYTGAELAAEPEPDALRTAGIPVKRRRALLAALEHPADEATMTVQEFLDAAGLADAPSLAAAGETARTLPEGAKTLGEREEPVTAGDALLSGPTSAPIPVYAGSERRWPGFVRWGLVLPGIAALAAVAGAYWSEPILERVDRGALGSWIEQSAAALPWADGSTPANTTLARSEVGDDNPRDVERAGSGARASEPAVDPTLSNRASARGAGASSATSTNSREVAEASGAAEGAVSASSEAPPAAGEPSASSETSSSASEAPSGPAEPAPVAAEPSSASAESTSRRSSDSGGSAAESTVVDTPTAPDDTARDDSRADAAAIDSRDASPTLSLDSDSVRVRESAGAVMLTVRSSFELEEPLEFVWRTSDGTAHAPDDYADLGARAERLAAGDSSVRLYVPIVDDSMPESAKHFFVHIEPSANGGPSTRTLEAKVTLIDDD